MLKRNLLSRTKQQWGSQFSAAMDQYQRRKTKKHAENKIKRDEKQSQRMIMKRKQLGGEVKRQRDMDNYYMVSVGTCITPV